MKKNLSPFWGDLSPRGLSRPHPEEARSAVSKDGAARSALLYEAAGRCYMSCMDQKRTFAVVLEPEDEGGFTVRVPAFPEIVTYGQDER